MPKCFNLTRRIEWSTLLKALEKSVRKESTWHACICRKSDQKFNNIHQEKKLEKYYTRVFTSWNLNSPPPQQHGTTAQQSRSTSRFCFRTIRHHCRRCRGCNETLSALPERRLSNRSSMQHATVLQSQWYVALLSPEWGCKNCKSIQSSGDLYSCCGLRRSWLFSDYYRSLSLNLV